MGREAPRWGERGVEAMAHWWPLPPTLVVAQCDTTPTAGRFGREDVTQFSVGADPREAARFQTAHLVVEGPGINDLAPHLSISRGQSDGTENSFDHAQLLVERRVTGACQNPTRSKLRNWAGLRPHYVETTGDSRWATADGGTRAEGTAMFMMSNPCI